MNNIIKLCLVLVFLSFPGMAQKIEVCKTSLSKLVNMALVEQELNRLNIGSLKGLASTAIGQSHHVFIRATDAEAQETYFHFQSTEPAKILGHKAELSRQVIEPDECEIIWEGDNESIFQDYVLRITHYFEERAQQSLYHILTLKNGKNCQTVVEGALQDIFEKSSPMLQETNLLVKSVHATLSQCCIQ